MSFGKHNTLRKKYSNWWFSQVCSIKTVEVRKVTDQLETETMIIEIPMLLKLILEKHNVLVGGECA